MIYSTESAKDQSMRRAELAQSLQGRGRQLGLAELIGVLAQNGSFTKYMGSTSGMMFPVAQLIPVLINGQLQSRVDGGQAVLATSATMARAFRDIWDYVRHASKAVYPVAEPASEYRFSDQRTMQMGGVPVTPDGVFYYPMYLGSEFHSVHALLEAQLEPNLDATSPDVLGKMADLAMSVWEAQPTRLFVPFLYLHGPMVSLVIFARSGYYCTTIGRLFHTSHDPSTDDISDVGDTLRYLWFLMTLPSDRFGHIVDVSVPAIGLIFTKFHSAATAAVAASRDSGPELGFQQRIPLPVSLLDFQSYLFKTQYHGQPAMLKLVWSPTYRLPEAAVYDWLLSNGCSAVPKVFESSIIANDVFGYRLEYLLIEDCGVLLLEYFKTEYGNVSDTSRRDADAEGVFKQLASCLAIAHSAGVVHCDISAEHIAVRSGHAFIFDWTRAQLATAEVPALLAKGLREKYSLSASDLQPLRWPRDDPVVQTAIYASIRSLWHDGTSSLVDGFESIFYVILHALYHSNHTPVGTPSAFKVLDQSTMAVVKTGCLADPELYLNYFGIADIGDELKAFLDKVRRFLFSADGIFVGGKLVDSGFERSERPELAKIFLFEKAFAAAYPEDVKPVCEDSVDSGAVRPVSLSFTSCAHLFPPTTKTSATSGVPATAPAAPDTTTSVAQTPAAPVTTATSALPVPVTATAASAGSATASAPAVTTTAPAAPTATTTAPTPAASVTVTSAPIILAASAAPVAPNTKATSSAVPSATALATSAATDPKLNMRRIARAARDVVKASQTTTTVATAPVSTSAGSPATSTPTIPTAAPPVTSAASTLAPAAPAPIAITVPTPLTQTIKPPTTV
ncbi:hypothetical protein GGI09_001073 [Coemansia sp. S100]|nr:hypothetical protein LPJ71_001116 [Coemansia sp. S17]KAJ2102710.1 hypothetical protein GGI09_001073 [Coemansia sp. S100]KAJ2110728.1 hypothetical protein GGI16_000165 [Coemansia sp. S142-1]